MRILLVEDEKPLADWLCKALAQSGFRVEWVDNGTVADLTVAAGDFDALVLDLGLPDHSGNEVIQRLRAADRRLPVPVLTARDSLAERVQTLNEGADDFLAKPFALPELEARLTALIRRARGVEHPRFACGPLGFDAVTRQFTLVGQPLLLPRREHALLRSLLQRSGEPLSRQHVIDRVFSDEDDVLPAAVDVQVHRLRKGLENAGVHIATYRGLGYVLEADGKSDPAR